MNYLASMFFIYKDMRVARAGRLDGSVTVPKLRDSHLGQTVTPTQVTSYNSILKM